MSDTCFRQSTLVQLEVKFCHASRGAYTEMQLFIISAAIAQTVLLAYAGHHGKAHVIYLNGVAKTVPPKQLLVDCRSISVARPWLVLVENGCASYRLSFIETSKMPSFARSDDLSMALHGRGDCISALFGLVHGMRLETNPYDPSCGSLESRGTGKAWFLNGRGPRTGCSSLPLLPTNCRDLRVDCDDEKGNDQHENQNDPTPKCGLGPLFLFHNQETLLITATLCFPPAMTATPVRTGTVKTDRS